MTTALAAQLAQIASKSTHQLDLKAQRKAHAQSLLYEPAVAGAQDFDTLYEICLGGFRELCQLDRRFQRFARNIFAEQSKTQDRSQMTGAQNEELNGVLEKFMTLVAPRLLLKPAIKAVEWLIRRFRVHEFNTEWLLTIFLPYHSMPMFATLLSIVPKHLPPLYRWLQPYAESLAPPTRQALINTAVRDSGFLTMWSNHVLEACRQGHQYQALTSYWATVACDAIIGQLDQNTAGRRESRKQKEEDIILRVLPILSEGLSMRKGADMRVGCFMVLTILASKVDLEDNVLRAMMEAVVGNHSHQTAHAEIICLTVLAQRRHETSLPQRVYRALIESSSLVDNLVVLNEQYEVGNLCIGLASGKLEEFVNTQEVSSLELISTIIEKRLVAGSNISVLVSLVLSMAQDVQGLDSDTKGRLGDFINKLAGSQGSQDIVRKSMERAQVDIQQLEAKLQTVLLPNEETLQITFDTEMQDIDSGDGSEDYETLKSKVLSETTDQVSFLACQEHHVFNSLYQTFAHASKSSGLLNDFITLPILRRSDQYKEPVLFSFYVKVWCGPYPSNVRTAALTSLRQTLQESAPTIDLQALLPYVIFALADPSIQVRRIATNVAIALHTASQVASSQTHEILGRNNLYAEDSNDVSWLDAKDVGSVLEHVFVPSLEECRLDALHIGRAVSRAINGSREMRIHDNHKKDMKSATRAAFLAFLASHAVHTPIFAVKERLLSVLSDVNKVGSMSKTRLLVPLLVQVETTASEVLQHRCVQEQLDQAEFCAKIWRAISPSDREGIKSLQRIILAETELVPISIALRETAIGWVVEMWTRMKVETQITIMQTLLNIAHTTDQISEKATERARQLDLSSEVLKALLGGLPSLSPDTRDAPTTPKRRRTSHGHVDGEASDAMKAGIQNALAKTNTVLELVEGSRQGSSPELIGPLFHILADIHNIKKKISIDFSYVQTIIFTCLYESMETARKSGTKVDSTLVRAELVVDCFRNTTNTQVQQSSLLLMSSLAALAPDLIVHSVMPIFTFMGSNMLRQADDYSSHVIERTIDSVIPPLIAAFRKDKRGALAGASELMLSFVAAFDHIPPSRRTDLFSALVDKLGTDEFLFALLVILADRYRDSKKALNFAAELFGTYHPVTQLTAITNYFKVVLDHLQDQPTTLSQYLITQDRGAEKVLTARALLQLPLHLLRVPRLAPLINRHIAKNPVTADVIRAVYARLIEQTLALANQRDATGELSKTCDSVLEALLSLLSVDESIPSLAYLLESEKEFVRRRVLNSINTKIGNLKNGSQNSRAACIGFIPRLGSILSDSPDILFQQSALVCLDRIAEKFGKTNRTEMEGVAKIVSGTYGLGSPEVKLQVMSLICLTTLVEVLGDAIVPFMPQAVPMAFQHLERSVRADHVEEALYNSVMPFIASLILYVPWMITGEYLDRFIKAAERSSSIAQADERRTSTLELVAKQITAQECFSALQRTWAYSVEQGTPAMVEHLTILSVAVDRHIKSVIVKNAQLLVSLFLEVLGLRSQTASTKFDNEDIGNIERKIGEIMIKIIYKLNDTHFRPIFIKMLDWANDTSSKQAKDAQKARQTSLYGFLHSFFDTLKSIVTSYAGLVADNAINILETSHPDDSKSGTLWNQVVSTLQSAFEHDQDGFWQSPGRFGLMCDKLLAQFSKAAEEATGTGLIKCMASFASATESTDNLKVINIGVIKHLRSESSRVRLTAVRCEISITERLDERIGNDWLFSLLPEMMPYIIEALEDDDEKVEMEVRRWARLIEEKTDMKLDELR